MGEEEKASIVKLILTYQKNKDVNILDKIVMELIPVAKKMARKLVRDENQLEDLVQVASIGILKAVNNYDNKKNSNFYGYLVPVIIGEIKHYYRDQSWIIKAPRKQKELCGRIHRISPDLAQKYGRIPTVADISKELCVTQEEVIEAMNYQNTYKLTSLEDSISSKHDSKSINLGQIIGEIDSNIKRVDNQSELKDILSKLNILEKKLLILRFVDRLTQKEIADILGISQMQVSRMIKSLLIKLKHVRETQFDK
ncbi:MAG: sigma-70 family RNA polymerase sigma factor [Clostridia bacterium]